MKLTLNPRVKNCDNEVHNKSNNENLWALSSLFFSNRFFHLFPPPSKKKLSCEVFVMMNLRQIQWSLVSFQRLGGCNHFLKKLCTKCLSFRYVNCFVRVFFMAFPHCFLLLFLEVCCPQEMDIPGESLLSLVPIDIPKVVAKSFKEKTSPTMLRCCSSNTCWIVYGSNIQ